MRLLQAIVCVGLGWTAFTAGIAGVILQPYEAPAWNVSEWINGDPGPLDNHRGRVVVIEFFQLWCPGCNEFSIPLMNAWAEQWKDRDDIMVVSIHTVFEGHDVQTPARLREFIREKRMLHPVAIDKYADGDKETPITMNRYHTGGTPHVAIVDKEGKLRFSHFGRFDPATIEAFVERLAKERGSGIRPGPRTLDPRGGRPTASSAGAQAARPPGRPGGSGPPPVAQKSDPTDPAGGTADKLSGTYQMQFQQKTKSCGTRERPQNLQAEITVSDDRIVARFKERFLGLNQFAADYDPATGEFSAQTMRRSDDRGVGVTLNMALRGKVELGVDPPTLRFDFDLDKEGDEPGWECKISGNGSATRSRIR